MVRYKKGENTRMSVSVHLEKMRRIRTFFFSTLTAVCIAGCLYFTELLRSEESVYVYAQERENEEKLEDVGALYAQSAVLMDANSMRVLVSKDGDTMRPMASTTKIMTCILALEEGNMEDIVTASKEASSQPAVHLEMQEGEQFRLIDLLYSLMLESHNDSAVAIAEHLYGSVEKFAERMNEKAREIGCENAHFVTPNGLDDADEGGIHSISASDLARIMSYCIAKSEKAETFLEITGTKSYTFSDISGKRSFSCFNHNLFLDMMEGAISGKTGFTGDAGYCYVGALKRGERTFVVALLACGWPNNKNYKWADTKALMEYALAHYEYQNVWKELDSYSVKVWEGIPEDEDIFAEAEVELEMDSEDKELNLLLSDSDRVKIEVSKVPSFIAPVEKGDEAGWIRYLLEDEVVKEYRLVAKNAVAKKEYDWVLRQMLVKFCSFNLVN